MTAQELISAGKDQVRSTPSLMSAYIEVFAGIFGRKPDCAGCTFNNDWQRLVNSQTQQIQNLTTMSTNTFKLRDQHKIYTYVNEDEETGIKRPVRTYGNLMSEEFAEKYLTVGSEDQIKERKAEFKVLPEQFRDKQTSGDEVKLSSLKVDDLKALAAEKQYPEDEYKSLKKDDLVAYLEAKAMEQTSGDEVNQ